MLKLSKNQLRSLVNDVVKQKITESRRSMLVENEGGHIADTFSPAVSHVILELLTEEADLLANNAYTMVSDVVESGNALLPTRYEDVEDITTEVVDAVLASPEIHDQLHNIVERIVRSMI